MIPQNEAIEQKTYLHLKCTEIDDLCDWLEVMREHYCKSSS